MTTTAPSPRPAPASPVPVVPVMVAEPGLRRDLQAVKVVMHRELIRFGQDRLRFASALVQPVLFLFVLGTGLSSLTDTGSADLDLRTFMYPGILATSTMFTAIFAAVSIVWDREFGFLREMMVAPIRRSSIVIGKCLGGASVAGIQGVIVICLAGVVHVPYQPVMIIEIFVLQLLLAFTITAFGVMIAVRIKQMQSFMGVMQMVVTPMFFISGALFPASGLPGWLTVLNRIDPLTYAVDPMRRIVFSHLNNVSPAARHALDPGVTWWGWHVPTLLEAGVIVVLGIMMLGVAIWEFSATE